MHATPLDKSSYPILSRIGRLSSGRKISIYVFKISVWYMENVYETKAISYLMRLLLGDRRAAILNIVLMMKRKEKDIWEKIREKKL